MQANIDGGEPDLQHLVHPATYKDLPGPRILPVPGGGYSEVCVCVCVCVYSSCQQFLSLALARLRALS